MSSPRQLRAQIACQLQGQPQPLDGGSPKQLTDFRDGIIFDFAWSRDGKQLALSRGQINSDVVLISNFK